MIDWLAWALGQGETELEMTLSQEGAVTAQSSGAWMAEETSPAGGDVTMDGASDRVASLVEAVAVSTRGDWFQDAQKAEGRARVAERYQRSGERVSAVDEMQKMRDRNTPPWRTDDVPTEVGGSLTGLDRFFERDARRYDGGFPLY